MGKSEMAGIEDPARRSTLGIIATSTLRKRAAFRPDGADVVPTRYGDILVHQGVLAGTNVAMVSRSGARYPLAPGLVNYRGIMTALRSLGVRKVMSSCAVGALRTDLGNGDLVNIDQFLDFSQQRPRTLFDEHGFRFADMTNPYCAELREVIRRKAADERIPLVTEGCYVGVDGPRFETAAEVRMYRMLGGDVVGHTGATEAIMAREAGLCYATIAIVTNPGAGSSERQTLTIDEINESGREHGGPLEDLLVTSVAECGSQLLDDVCKSCPPPGTWQSAPWMNDDRGGIG